MVPTLNKPEVLAPAGDADALTAAVRAGADAVYFGLQDYNARIRARNFTVEELPGIVNDLHRDGVRVYVTFNTLLFSSETKAAWLTLEKIAAAGPDAVLVQDLGVARSIHEKFPDLTIHASTQMTISSREGIDFLSRFGIRRVILARELTLPEIRRVREQTTIELEVFVHGALCVSYSGQCLSSEAWGGRSANRGQCAQACRLPYDLLVDGSVRDLGERAYLLSPRDLEGYRRIPDLIEAGIDGLKIEGRMKSAEYVAAATRLYREAVDRAWDARAQDGSRRPAVEVEQLAERTRHVFSRGESEGFLGGINHQILVDGTIRSHRGARVGVISRLDRGLIEIVRDAGSPPLSPGDGLLVARGPAEEDETGGKIFAVETIRGTPDRLRVRFVRGLEPRPAKTTVGSAVYLTHDHRLQSDLRRLFKDPTKKKQIPLSLSVTGKEGAPLAVSYTDLEGRAVRVESGVVLERASRHPLDEETLVSHLGRLGDTRYRLERIAAELEGELALPVSEMNRLRRAAVQELDRIRSGPLPSTAPPGDRLGAGGRGDLASPVADAVARAEASAAALVESRAAGAIGGEQGSPDAPERADPFLLLCRTRDQVTAAVRAGASRVVLDFLDLTGLKEAAAEIRGAGAEMTLALPRIQKPGEEKIWDFFLAQKPDAILVRNLASLERLSRTSGGPVLVGDVSLNAVNPDSIRVLLEAGCARVTPGFDLNAEQLLDLLGEVPADRLEIPLHGHLPVFHTEHCVFAAFLSDGADWRSCGRPCDRHALHLRDRTGEEHVVIADVGCRNTVFGAKPQSVLHLLPELRRRGVAHLRLELLEQDVRATADLIDVYRSVWDGTRPPADGLRRLRAEARFGISGGSPEPPRRPDWKPRGGRRPGSTRRSSR
jgi:U32 family peptidase